MLAGAGAVRARDARVLCAQLAAALAYAHTCGVFHGALRARDVLLTARGTPKLSGFGVFAPPPNAAAPAAAADAYACGALLQRLLPPAAPPAARDLVAMLTHPDPARRPALAAAARHPWLAAALPPPRAPLALPAPPSRDDDFDEGDDPPSPPSSRARSAPKKKSLRRSPRSPRSPRAPKKEPAPLPPVEEPLDLSGPDHVPLMTTLQAIIPGMLPEPLSPPPDTAEPARRRSRIPPPTRLASSSAPNSTGSAAAAVRSAPNSTGSVAAASGARRKVRRKSSASHLPPLSPVTPPPPPLHAAVDAGELEYTVRAMVPARLHSRATEFASKLEAAGVDDEADLRFVLQCKGGARATGDWLERVAHLSPLVALRIASAVELRAETA